MGKIFQYFRNRNKIKGLFVAIKKENGDIAVGYSLCCNKDRFCKETARSVALERANSFCGSNKNSIPISMLKDFNKFLDRASRYFKVEKEKIFIC
jgi:hypothetical protein